MNRCLITQTLLSAWNYMHDCYESSADTAYDDFLRTLNREPKDMTPEMQNGIDFENEVYRAAAGMNRFPHPKWEAGIQKAAAIIRSAPVQVKVQREMTLDDGMTFLVYGILDSLKAGTIYDVKFSNKGFASAELAGKYLGSAQHPAYLFMVPEAFQFTYLVSDGTDLYTETYTRSNTQPIQEIVKEFIDDLKALKLLDVYMEKWGAHDRQA